MPNKDPHFLSWITDLIRNTPTLQGVCMAMIIAFFRVIYFGERKLLSITFETVLCGLLSLSTSGVLDVIEACSSIVLLGTVIVPLSSMVGFIGVKALSEFLIKKLGRVNEFPPRRDDEL